MVEVEPSIVDMLVDAADDEPHFRRECSCFTRARPCDLVAEHDELRSELEREERVRRARAARVGEGRGVRPSTASVDR
jgi:hypothetical protein